MMNNEPGKIESVDQLLVSYVTEMELAEANELELYSAMPISDLESKRIGQVAAFCEYLDCKLEKHKLTMFTPEQMELFNRACEKRLHNVLKLIKLRLAAANKIRIVPCLFCIMPIEAYKEAIKGLSESFKPLANHGFHCNHHASMFHTIL
jgi:hypothetical protein